MKTAQKLGMLALAALATASCLDHPLMVDPAGDDPAEAEVVERAEPLIRFFSFTYMGPGPAPVIGPDRWLVLVEEADRGWSREEAPRGAPVGDRRR